MHGLASSIITPLLVFSHVCLVAACLMLAAAARGYFLLAGVWARSFGITEPVMGSRLPGPPTAPITTDIAFDSLTLSWGPPASNGGQAIASYRIFVQAGGTSGFSEFVASTGTPDTAAYRVRGLTPQVDHPPSNFGSMLVHSCRTSCVLCTPAAVQLVFAPTPG